MIDSLFNNEFQNLTEDTIREGW